MRNQIQTVFIIWISTVLLSGCVSSKDKIFGSDMPTMVEIHNEKFKLNEGEPSIIQSRPIVEGNFSTELEFKWLPNPVMTMFVTPHLTQAGQPVPGYATYFRFYHFEHIALPGEIEGWE